MLGGDSGVLGGAFLRGTVLQAEECSAPLLGAAGAAAHAAPWSLALRSALHTGVTWRSTTGFNAGLDGPWAAVLQQLTRARLGDGSDGR